MFLLHSDLFLGIVIHRHCCQVSQGEAVTSMNLSADPLVLVQPRPFFDDRLSEEGTSVFGVFSLSVNSNSIFSSNGSKSNRGHRVVTAHFGVHWHWGPTLRRVDKNTTWEWKWHKNTTLNENDTSQQLCLMGMLGGRVGTFWGGFLCLGPQLSGLSANRDNTKSASILVDMIDKLFRLQVSVARSEIVASGSRCCLRSCWCQCPNWQMHQPEGWEQLCTRVSFSLQWSFPQCVFSPMCLFSSVYFAFQSHNTSLSLTHKYGKGEVGEMNDPPSVQEHLNPNLH